MKIRTEIKRNDEAAEVVAEMFDTTATYVRQIINGRVMKTTEGKAKAQHILTTYQNYIKGKDVLKNKLTLHVEKILSK